MSFFLYFCIFSQGYFSIVKIITHVLYLPWFDKIIGFGHLWFMTMIAICYAGCYLVSQYNIDNISQRLNLLNMIGGILLDYVITYYGLPSGYIFPYLIGYLLIFSHAEKIIGGVRRIPVILNIMQAHQR